MALFKKAAPAEVIVPVIEEKTEEIKVAEPVKAAFQPAHTTLIGKGITFTGNFLSDDPIEIRGAVHGDIIDSNLVTVFQNSEYVGNAQIADFVISGYVKGNVACKGLTTVTASGKMEGNLKTSELKTDVGSAFSGSMILDYAPAAAASHIDYSEDGEDGEDEVATEEYIFG